MALSWNEIKDRALQFSKEWADTTNEEADAKPFLDAFFNVFGISRKKVATFEERVKKLDDHDGYIDLLWKGTLLVEMKSRGKDLDKAFVQAKEYVEALKEHEIPDYILISDFEKFRLHNLVDKSVIEFKISQLINFVEYFGFIAGYQKYTYKEQDPVNIQAAELMGVLHDKLKGVGYEGHQLEVYLVRILFCLFADDTTIFDKNLFYEYINQRTNEDGSDLGSKLSELFYVLDTPREKRLKNLDEQLNSFPYVNGKLFEEYLPPASFDKEMRNLLLNACLLDWGKISPAIFGSMFQSVKNPVERRNLGAHYTSEKNILKLIKPLFLDELWEEFESIKHNKNKLIDFHKKLSRLKFLDPACGCGNFLVVTYRELRLLELEILRILHKETEGQGFLDVSELVFLDVDMMYGIEYDEFPAKIAEVAMWLIDHQVNMAISNEFGQYFVRLPLKKSAVIVHGNALRLDWETIISRNELSYIIGNPPFVGSKLLKNEQRKEMANLFKDVKDGKILDYVSAWYLLAAIYIKNTKIKVAYVSTNSITQGEQVGVLWNVLLNDYKIKIHFAHNTFKWSNEARGKAAVYCVIIGFANFDVVTKYLFSYSNINGEPTKIKCQNINPYLVDASDKVITRRSKPINDVPKMSFGNMPLDGGNFLFTNDEKEKFVLENPMSLQLFRPLISAREYLNNEKRWCLWLKDVKPELLKAIPEVLKRVQAVKEFRLSSVAPSTQKHAITPTLFRDRNTPDTYILIPSTTSEKRTYIPMGFFDKQSIANNSCHIISNAKLYHLGILISIMHMVWVKYVCGRLKGDFRYSKDIVYNNYPWPKQPSEKNKKLVEERAQIVLDVRAKYPDSSLADLYNPLTMPADLVKAHSDLDKAVDLCYRPQPFPNEKIRIEYLFELYNEYTAPLIGKEKKVRKKN